MRGSLQNRFYIRIPTSCLRVFTFFFLLSSAFIRAEETFPKGPDLSITPGALCDNPS